MTKLNSVLGLDVSTQSLSAVLLDCASGQIIWSHSLSFRDDARLLGLGFCHDSLIIPPREMGEAEQPPLLFSSALEALFDDAKEAKIALNEIAAINVSGQQHGHIYLNAAAKAAFAGLHAAENTKNSLSKMIETSFAYGGAPIWKTANTVLEAAEIRARVGGQQKMIELSGSDIPLRFSVCAHRKIGKRYAEAWQNTARVMQISSFIPALLCGDANIPIDFGSGCGTGLMNYHRKLWEDKIIDAAAQDLIGGKEALRDKLPEIVHPLQTVGKIAPWFVARYQLNRECLVIAGSGDNPQSKVLASGDLLSLGTSFVYMVNSGNTSEFTSKSALDFSGSANAMYDGLGRAFNFACRTNGALTWDKLRLLYKIPMKDFVASEHALENVDAGSLLRFWHPDSESFPLINANAEIQRFDNQAIDFAHDYSALVDSALGLMYRFGAKIKNTSEAAKMVGVCGGPSASPQILARVAAIWNCPALEMGQAGAALGAAVSAAAALITDLKTQEKCVDELRNKLFADKNIVRADAQQVAKYHAKGAYLDQLEAAFLTIKNA